jgi:hypothetical protein
LSSSVSKDGIGAGNRTIELPELPESPELPKLGGVSIDLAIQAIKKFRQSWQF